MNANRSSFVIAMLLAAISGAVIVVGVWLLVAII